MYVMPLRKRLFLDRVSKRANAKKKNAKKNAREPREGLDRRTSNQSHLSPSDDRIGRLNAGLIQSHPKSATSYSDTVTRIGCTF